MEPIVTFAPPPLALITDDLAERLALHDMVAAAFPNYPFMANHVVWRESIGDWNKNWRCTVYGGCWSPTNDCGLLQENIINAHYYTEQGWDMSVDCFDPVKNIIVGQAIMASQGPRAWGY